MWAGNWIKSVPLQCALLAPLSRPRSRNNNQTEQYGCAAAPVLDCFSSFVVCVNPATRRARPPCNNNKENKTMRSRRRRSRRAKVKGRGREKTSVRLVIITFAANDPLYFLFLGIIFYYIFFSPSFMRREIFFSQQLRRQMAVMRHIIIKYGGETSSS